MFLMMSRARGVSIEIVGWAWRVVKHGTQALRVARGVGGRTSLALVRPYSNLSPEVWTERGLRRHGD